MRCPNVVFALLLAVPPGAVAAEPATATQQAQAWLELLDSGRYAQAWQQTAATVQRGTDLSRWSQAQIAARGSGQPSCRKSLGLQRHEAPTRVDAVFVTQFADGRRIAEKVTLSAAEEPTVQAYRVGPPPADPAARCSAADKVRRP